MSNFLKLFINKPSNFQNFTRDYSDYLGQINCCSNKYPGQTGVTGFHGFQGPTGAYGFTGMMGENGPHGPIGFDSTGATGTSGVQGVIGPAGEPVTGPIGPIGPDGLPGPTGQPGDTGPKGEQGIQGTSGPQGPTGYAGPIGQIGVTGVAGVTGTVGVTGGVGITFMGEPANSINLMTYGTQTSLQIAPYTAYTWNINAYGQSSVAFPSTRIGFSITGFSGVNPPSSTVFTDVYGNNYQVYIFAGEGAESFTMQNPYGSGGYVNMCLIGGGGGGAGTGLGLGAGGAGAGQLMFVDNYFMKNGQYSVTVGSGGSGGTANTSGISGTSTILADSSANQLFLAAGGAGGVISSGSASSGLTGSSNVYPNPTNLIFGTSSGSGGTSSNKLNGTGKTVNYQDIIVPGVNLSTQIWSYGNDGGMGFDLSGNVSGGAGGGAGGVGGDGTATHGGLANNGVVIYFDASYGRAVCSGGDGGGALDNDYNSIYPYPPSPNAYLYNYTGANPPSGYPSVYSYGAGTNTPSHKNAYANTGSGGAPGKSTGLDKSGGNGGSGLFMIRYNIP